MGTKLKGQAAKLQRTEDFLAPEDLARSSHQTQKMMNYSVLTLTDRHSGRRGRDGGDRAVAVWRDRSLAEAP